MKNKMTSSLFLDKLKEGIRIWLKLNLLLLVFMFVLRLFFYAEVHFRLDIDASRFWTIMSGLHFDVLLWCRITAFFALPFLLLYLAFPKTTPRIYLGLVFLYGVVSALLTEYFCNLSMPLDHVILVYTPEEVKGTAASSASITATPFLWFFGTMAVLVALSLLWKKWSVGVRLAVVLLLLAVVLSCVIPYKQWIREERNYKEHNDFCLAVNQPSYSYIKITDYLRETRQSLVFMDHVDSNVLEAAKRYQALHPEFDYIDPEYPFYRKANDPDVLGTLLEKTDDNLPPNLVFIIVEGLGQRLTGVEHPAVSFTPFIDSLKQQGLYWENCLSSAERTFGVLPAIFVSAPLGKYGFGTSNRPMPDHQSLFRDLKDNGYSIAYYYGCIPNYGRYDALLKANDVDFICHPDTQNIDSTNYQLLTEWRRWGFDDRDMVQQMIRDKQQQPATRPKADILMTLTTHEPFLFDQVKAYEKLVLETLEQHPEVSERERENIVNNTNIFACYRYLDDCVRELVNYYQTLPEYRNTLFILTGDHRMAYLSFTGTLNKYQVPLLLFSPLVKQPRTMKAVVSHLDLTPTLNSYFRANYDYHTGTECHWLGTSLDTVQAFRNTKKTAFMLNNRDVVEYVNDRHLLSNNRLFAVDEDLLVHPEKDERTLERLKSELADYQVVSQFAVLHDHLNLRGKDLKTLKKILLDFESYCDSYYSRYIKERDDNHVVYFDSTKVYIPMLQDLPLELDYENIYIDFAFDLQGLDAQRELPLLVVELDDFYASMRLNAEDDTSLNTGKQEHFQTRLSIPAHGKYQGKTLKAYLFNYNKTTLWYDNLQIVVSAKR